MNALSLISISSESQTATPLNHIHWAYKTKTFLLIGWHWKANNLNKKKNRRVYERRFVLTAHFPKALNLHLNWVGRFFISVNIVFVFVWINSPKKNWIMLKKKKCFPYQIIDNAYLCHQNRRFWQIAASDKKPTNLDKLLAFNHDLSYDLKPLSDDTKPMKSNINAYNSTTNIRSVHIIRYIIYGVWKRFTVNYYEVGSPLEQLQWMNARVWNFLLENINRNSYNRRDGTKKNATWWMKKNKENWNMHCALVMEQVKKDRMISK